MPKPAVKEFEPYWETSDRTTARLWLGDAAGVLRQLPARSVHCCITSPPYWGLRDYGVAGQLGAESTPEGYVAKMVEVFREVRRVLRDDGTLWLNLGDSYSGGGGYSPNSPSNVNGSKQSSNRGSKIGVSPPLPSGNLVGIPWRVAFALQADGWVLRQDIIWHKPSAMPESVKNRCTKEHEYVFLLAKRGGYYYDAEAVKETQKSAYSSDSFLPDSSKDQNGDQRMAAVGVSRANGSPDLIVSGANKRSVWSVTSAAYSGAHFATFPPKLIEPMILAGTSERGCCSRCGAPWRRVTEWCPRISSSRPQVRRANEIAIRYGLTPAHFNAIRAVGSTDVGKSKVTQGGAGKNRKDVQKLAEEAKKVLGGYYREFVTGEEHTLSWEPTCSCNALTIPCTVIDPFAGSGTTPATAIKLGRRGWGIDLSEVYLRDHAARRIMRAVSVKCKVAHLTGAGRGEEARTMPPVLAKKVEW
jgi:DNA modification methylase